ncbi:serine hydrolase domain-containing protein [Saccharomonospora azurea]
MTMTTGRRLIALVGGVALAATAGIAPASATPADDHAETQAVLDAYHANTGPGAAVHAGDSTESWTLSSGTATVFEDRPITATDHFRIASQTKTFTAAVVLQLFDEGRVDLDAPIEQYLPGVVTGNFDGTVITVRQLLNHTSGLPRDVAGAAANPDGTYELAALVASAMDDAPQSAPGEALNYSNIGYLVLGMLIEDLTGQSVGDAITERIIEPLGLTDTSFPAPGDRELPAPYVNGYQGFKVGGAFVWLDWTTRIELSAWSSAGAMASTFEDLATFYRALLDGDVISEAALDDMRGTPNSIYGLGLFAQELSCGGVAWGHNGRLATGHASRTMVTEDGRFASVLTNTVGLIQPSDPSEADVVDAALCEGQ